MGPAAISCSQTRSAAAVLPNPPTLCLGERLSPKRHHVGHRVDIDGLKVVVVTSADIAEFNGGLAVNLPLHGQIELMAHARPEVRVQRLTRPSSLRIHSRKDRLWQSRQRGLYRRHRAIETSARWTDPEGVIRS